ncbi:MAG: peptide chain release factor 1 [Planctomycetota bacterium]|jgi:peptide chain release factor 1
MDLPSALINALRERTVRHVELTDMLADPELAADPKRFPAVLRERGSLERSAQMYAACTALEEREHEAEEILASEDGGGELGDLAREDLEAVKTESAALREEIQLALIADPEDDRTKIIFEIRAGTGGDEATLFVGDLYRMYTKYFESHRWRIEVMAINESEVGGYKELTFGVSGDGVWRRLRFESGVHRVQRVPATETKGRVHTSAATVAVLPEAEEADVSLADGDLRVDTMRSSGPGGQSVNKTSSAVRITHLPTDTVVVCQDEKSQHKNKAKAMRILRSRLFEAEQARINDERSEQRKSLVGTGDRSGKVRTYNWPQNRVTDHRLDGDGAKNFSLEQVIGGRLAPVLDALEAMDQAARLEAL